MKTLSQFHDAEKPLSAVPVFKSLQGKTIAISLKKGGHLKSHTTPVSAVIVNISGKVKFQNEEGVELALTSGDYFEIEPNVKHWLEGLEDAQLLLLK